MSDISIIAAGRRSFEFDAAEGPDQTIIQVYNDTSNDKMAHKVQYVIDGEEKTHEAFTQTTFESRKLYHDWADDMRETLARVHHVDPKEIVITEVWTL